MTKKKKKNSKKTKAKTKQQQKQKVVAFDVKKEEKNKDIKKQKERKPKENETKTHTKKIDNTIIKEDKKDSPKLNRITYFSHLRAIASVAVVILHSAFAFAGGETLNDNIVNIAMIIRNCFLWAVPVFVMISGALLLNPNKEMTYQDIFNKYLKKIIILLFAFTLINEAFDVLVLGERFERFFGIEYIIKVLTDGSWPHMWYLYMLTGIYLLLPIYRLAIKNMEKKDFQYLLIIYFIFLSIQPLIKNILGMQSAFYIMTTTIYPFYLFIGYAIHANYINIPKNYAYGGIVVGLLGVMLTTYYDKTYSIVNYAFPLVILLSICLFAIAKDSAWMNKENKYLDNMDYASLGIYLLHLIPIKFMLQVMQFNNHLWQILPLAIISYVISFVITFLYKKIG